MTDSRARIENIQNKPAVIFSSLVTLLYLALGWMPENGFWGVNHLYFHPLPLRLVLSLLVLIGFFLPVGRWLSAIHDKTAGWNKWLVGGALMILAALLFSYFRVAVHSLGDGYQRGYEITRGQWYQPTQFLDYLVHVGLYRLLDLWFGARAVTAMAITSILAGVGFVLLLWTNHLFAGPRKLLFSLAVLSLGCSQLFFGYAESYTLLYLFAVWYLLLVFKEGDLRSSFVSVAIVYLLAAFSHQMGMLLLLPSFWYFSYDRFRQSNRKYVLFPLALLIGLLPYITIKILNAVIGFDEIREIAGYFLPLIGSDYGIFNPTHLFDIFNLFLLAAPVLVFMAPMIPMVFRNGRQKIQVMTVVIPSFLFILIFNPELTLARDWDAFSIPVAMIAISSLVLIVRALPNRLKSTGFGIPKLLGPAFIMLFSWILLNNSVPAHLTRAEYLLDHAVRGKRYGYELLAYYYYSNEDHMRELEMLEKIEEDDRTARVYGKLAQAAWLLGKGEEAYDFAHKGVELPNPSHLTFLMAGVTAFDRAEFIESISFLRAAKISPRDHSGLCKLGDALFMADSLDAATEVYQSAIRLDHSQARPYISLAQVYYKQGDNRLAQTFCREGLRRDPKYPGGQNLWNLLQASEAVEPPSENK